MAFLNRVIILVIAAGFFCAGSRAQNAPVGYWSSHLPYNSAIGVVTDGTTLYTISNNAFFTYNVTGSDAPVPYSKVSGMSDVGMQCVVYDSVTRSVVLVYSNGNIDIYKDNVFYNIPDFKLLSITGDKKVNQVLADNGMAYICTTLGLLVIDLTDNSIYRNYTFTYFNEQISVNGLAASGNFFYAVTNKGLFKIAKDDPQIQNFHAWQRIDSVNALSSIVSSGNTLFAAARKKIYVVSADTLQLVHTSPTNILHISAGQTGLLVGTGHPLRSLKVMDATYNLVDSFSCPDSSAQAVQLADNTIWIATPAGGLQKRSGTNQLTPVYPDGPTNPYAFDIYAFDRNLFIAHGGYTSNYFINSSTDGISNLKNGTWTAYKAPNFPSLGSVRDFVALARNESTGDFYMGSYLNGLYVMKPNGDITSINPPLFDGSIAYGQDYHQVMSLAMDRSDNLWVTLMFAANELYVKTPDDNWYKFNVPGISFGGRVITDDSGQVWVAGAGGDGLTVYNTNNTVGDINDDKSYRFTKGPGSGNLPVNKVNCMAKDKKNQVWIGTDNGVAIIRNCMAGRTAQADCDAEIPYVNHGSYSGNLFEGVSVKDIAIDGADRKWVGTTDGVYLLSPDAQQVIYRFTKDNSPLPSDYIQKIAIDKATGDVYIGTDNGLVCYRSTATEGAADNNNVDVFPNPVPSGYSGAIAIKGLTPGADVRITDMSGQLVYKTNALGGQATWNGRDYTGHKPQSGVYPVFISDGKGKQTHTAKIVFIQ